MKQNLLFKYLVLHLYLIITNKGTSKMGWNTPLDYKDCGHSTTTEPLVQSLNFVREWKFQTGFILCQLLGLLQRTTYRLHPI